MLYRGWEIQEDMNPHRNTIYRVWIDDKYREFENESEAKDFIDFIYTKE